MFWVSLRNTCVYVLLTVPIGTSCSLAIAIMLSSVKKMKGFFRSLFFVPSVAGVIVIGIVFTWIYEPYNGLINMFLGELGVGRIGWLRDVRLALPSVAAMTIWRTVGYHAIILLAGVMAIPRSYYESADIDGASVFRKHIFITLPLIMPPLLFVIINNTIRDLKVFSEIFIMTGGGPGHATVTIAFRIYQEAFLYFSYGKASAMAIILLVFILIITLFQIKSLGNKNVSY